MEQLFNITSLAGVLAVKPPTIRKWIREGLPYFRLGKLIRFRTTEVSAWLETKKARPVETSLEYYAKLPLPIVIKPLK